VRGLNWPNKQEDVKLFLHANNIGVVGLLETKIKEKKVKQVASNMLKGWSWAHSFSPHLIGRIWVA